MMAYEWLVFREDPKDWDSTHGYMIAVVKSEERAKELVNTLNQSRENYYNASKHEVVKRRHEWLALDKSALERFSMKVGEGVYWQDFSGDYNYKPIWVED